LTPADKPSQGRLGPHRNAKTPEKPGFAYIVIFRQSGTLTN
jgi:hypothetical protein